VTRVGRARLTMAENKEEDKYAAEDFSKYLPDSAKVDQPSQQWQLPSESSSRINACFQRIKTGAMLGGALGGSFGFLYGTYAAIAYRHILYIPISVVQAGFGFGLFLACGMIIRCDEGAEPEPIAAAPSNAALMFGGMRAMGTSAFISAGRTPFGAARAVSDRAHARSE